MIRPTISISKLRKHIMFVWKLRTGNFVLPEFILNQMLSYHVCKLRIEVICLCLRLLALIKIIKIEDGK